MATIRTLIGNIKGPKGDTGATGAKGDTGDAATVRVGSTTTSAAGTSALVENVGTEKAAVLNFRIPQGPPGSIGEIYNYAVNAITSQSAKFPVPAVGETIAQIVGKQAKATQDARDTISNILGDFGTVEPAATASKAYAVGDYLVLDGKFYKVTAAIAQGNALTVGGNIAATNIGAEVTALKNDLSYPSAELSIPTNVYSAVSVKNVMRVGNLCIVNFWGQLISPIAGSGAVLATIPTGYRPKANTAINFFGKYSDILYPLSGTIRTDGAIVSQHGSSQISTIINIFSAAYLA